MDIGSTIRIARKRKSMSQLQLADQLGVSKGYVSLIESEQKKPSIKILKQLSGILNIPVVLLISEDVDVLQGSLTGQEAELLREFQSMLEEIRGLYLDRKGNHASGT